MIDDFTLFYEELMQKFQEFLSLLEQPVILVQVAVLILSYLLSLLFGSKFEVMLENQARKIKDSPRLLRLAISLLRRSQWIVFIILTGMAYALMNNLGWPNTYLLYLALLLSMAWLAINVMTQTIKGGSFRQFLSAVIWFVVAINILGISENVGNFMEVMGFSVGNFRISLMLVVKVIFFLGITLWVSITLGNYFDRRLQRNEELAPGLRILIGKIVRITLIIMAVLIALSGIGIDLTIFSVLSGAIGVGIGFGLQKVVSNFISGLIILADRSIKPGDTITLGETFGWIRELRARYVSVVTRDGREYLIPNEDFITTEVINWSFSDDLIRLDVPFGVSYLSDPHQVSELAIEVTSKVDRVVDTKTPVCWLTEFGDSSLNFLLRFWIRDPQNGLTNIRGQVMMALWDTFKENDISIPYPHRELVTSKPIAVTLEDKK